MNNQNAEVAPSISVVIPAKNSASTILRCLASVTKQTVKPLEIIVVDGGSFDGTEQLTNFKGITVITEPKHRGMFPAIARNFGARRAKGDILVFLDADCYMESNTLERLQQMLSNPSVGVCGIVVSAFDSGLIHRAYHFLQKKISYDFVPSRCMAVYSLVFDSVGGFDAELSAGEDNEFSYRVKSFGLHILVDKGGIVYHDDAHTKTISGIWDQQKWYASSEDQLRITRPDKFKRFKTSVPIREHVSALLSSLYHGPHFALACLFIKFLAVWRHLR